MCGILGWIHPALSDSPAARAAVGPAICALRRRGPDGNGLAAGSGWLLGHTRLAILDLTAAADQPMADGIGNWLVFNGEIYNFQDLRRELEGHGYTFRSTGDTEVVLKALHHWGPAALERLRGMFALAWLDVNSRRLLLARDRYGVKPLVYEVRGDEFRFGSDLFAMRALPDPPRSVDSEAAYLFLGLGYVPAPFTILSNVQKLLPGNYLQVRWGGNGPVRIEKHPYWSISSLPPAATSMSTASNLLNEYTAEASEAVRLRLISDVPVGTLLSGGIDSTLVTALCREQPGANIPSFTMGFTDPIFDEAPFARRIANRLGGQHYEFRTTETDALAEWDRLWEVYDEPFADSSAIPTIGLCREIVRHVKVALSGDGGDETFGGYPWHRALDRAERRTQFLRGACYLGAQVPALSWDHRFRFRVMAEPDRVGRWAALRTGLSDTEARQLPVEGAGNRPSFREYFASWGSGLAAVLDPIDWACRMDLLTYLPDDLMVKTDRASMHFSLELREPFLDHKLTGWLLQLPIGQRYNRSTRTSKLLSREALACRMPRDFFDRPKQGFTPPLNVWLDGPLRDLAQSTVRRLARGDLTPLTLGPGAKVPDSPWRQCLWRVMCFAGWLDQHQASLSRLP